jgi:hypothetical protein
MFTHLSRLFGLDNSANRKPRHSIRRGQGRRLRFEALEGRQLLAADLGWIQTLHDVDDSGAGYNDVAVDPAENSISVGNLKGTVDFDPSAGELLLTGVNNLGGSGFVAKYDPVGSVLWAIAVSGSATMEELDVDDAGSIYVTGVVEGPSTIGSFVLMDEFDTYETPFTYAAKLDASGAVLWASIVTNGGGGGGIVADSEGRVTIAGQGLMTQFDNSGAVRWSLVNSVDLSSVTDLAIDSQDNVIVASRETISKYTADGSPVWSRSFSPGANSLLAIQTVAIDGSDNIYSTGQFRNTVDFDPSSRKFNLKSTNYAAFVSKLSPAGNFGWAKAIGGGTSRTSQARGIDLALDAANNVYVVGGYTGTVDFNPGSGVASRTSTNGGSTSNFLDDGFLVKLDASGNFQFVVTVGGTGSPEIARGVAVTASGTIKVVGYLRSTGVDFDPDPTDTYLVSSLDPAKGSGYLWSLNQIP